MLAMERWSITFTRAAVKGLHRMPERVQLAMAALVVELEVAGPALHGRGWKNFGKLKGRADEYHCHIVSGRPTYVACWRHKRSSVRNVEVFYVGTHEKAPY
jgi:hypothetical protein